MIVGDIPRHNARRSPQQLGIVDGSSRSTWAAVDERVERLATALRETMALPDGARVAVLADNCAPSLELLFACSRAGLVHVAMDPTLSAGDATDLLEHAEPRVLAVGGDHRALGAALAADADLPVIDLDGDAAGTSYERLLESAPARRRSGGGDPDAVYSIAYTSGSTGRPKGVPQTSRAKLARIHGVTVADRPRATDVQAVVGPLHHQGPEYHVLTYAYTGSTVVVLPRFDAGRLVEAIDREGVTAFQAVPTMLKRLVDHVEHEGRPRAQLRLISYGSSRTDPEVVMRAHDLFRCAFAQLGGGGTEGGPGLFLSQEDHEAAFRSPARRHLLESCGRPTPGFQVRIVDGAGDEVAPGEVGELVLDGDAYVRRYWRDDAATEAAWRDGWLHLGDLARRDEEGYHFYVGRVDGRIKTGGKTVYADEVELALLRHERVREAAVFGVPSIEWGEAVWAVVAADGVTPDELRAHLRAHLARHKVPKIVDVRTALPHTSSGKISYASLGAEALQQAGRP